MGVGEEHGPDDWGAGLGLGVHGCVDVVEQAVTDIYGGFGSFGDYRPEVEFLRGRAVGVVVAVEGLESACRG